MGFLSYTNMALKRKASQLVNLLASHTKTVLGLTVIFTYMVLVHGLHLLALTHDWRNYKHAPLHLLVADYNTSQDLSSVSRFAMSTTTTTTTTTIPSTTLRTKLTFKGEMDMEELTFQTGAPSSLITVAICSGITSAGIRPRKVGNRTVTYPPPAAMTVDQVKVTFPLFTAFLPSFCKTASKGYLYKFYFAYDHTDDYFSSDHQMAGFKDLFNSIMSTSCPKITYSLHMMSCRHAKHPAWAQNDAVMEAYLDGATYLYRVNDDSELLTPGWTEAFISALAGFRPPNVGCVGPHHSGGNMAILTYDFTHYTHQDIFGFHYPRTFTDWYADDWITRVYLPKNMMKLTNQKLRHTMSNGMRYIRHLMGPQLRARLPHDRMVLKRYIEHKMKKPVAVDPGKVISMAIHNLTNQHAVMGALHNTQLARIIFPQWTVRIYLLSHNAGHENNRILKKISSLGAKIYVVKETSVDDRLAALTAIQDDSVRHLLVRSARHRLDDRQKKAVDEWLASDKRFHCIKDHPTHVNVSVVPDLFGIRTEVGQGISLFNQIADALIYKANRTEDALWSIFKESALCHDSLTCDSSSHSRPLGGVAEGSRQFIGQSYDRYLDPLEVGLVQQNVTSKCGRSIAITQIDK